MTALGIVAEHLSALGLRHRTTADGLILIGFSGENTPYEVAIDARGPIISVVTLTVSMAPRPRLEETIRVVNLLNATKVMFGSFWGDSGRRRVAFELALAVPEGPTRGQVDLAMSAPSQIDDCFPIWPPSSGAARPPRPRWRRRDLIGRTSRPPWTWRSDIALASREGG